ncbi:MAG: hypothetical protein EZS28_010327, partial [Streblomastix strix]
MIAQDPYTLIDIEDDQVCNAQKCTTCFALDTCSSAVCKEENDGFENEDELEPEEQIKDEDIREIEDIIRKEKEEEKNEVGEGKEDEINEKDKAVMIKMKQLSNPIVTPITTENEIQPQQLQSQQQKKLKQRSKLQATGSVAVRKEGPYSYPSSFNHIFITPLFTKSMAVTHTIICPTMSPFSNPFYLAVIRRRGYTSFIPEASPPNWLPEGSKQVLCGYTIPIGTTTEIYQTSLSLLHNDLCIPAHLFL